MKILIIIALLFHLILANCAFARVYVEGYYRSDGTYVRPHYRSDPDGFKWNNYGSPSYKQQKEWESYPVIPSYQNDYDNDKIPNYQDYDDDNDALIDDFDPNQYRNDWTETPVYQQQNKIESDSFAPSYQYDDSNYYEDKE